MGLVRGDSNTVPLGIVIGWSLWLVLIGVALAEGVASRVFALGWSGGHARLLVVIPLFFVGEAWFNPELGRWVSSLSQRAGVAELERPALTALVHRLRRLAGSWIGEAVALVAAVLVGVFGGHLQPYGATTAFSAARAEFLGTLTAAFYWATVPVIFRFLLFRWVWRLAMWWWFLAQLARLRLRLLPGHPDRAGGLSGLEGVQFRLLPLVFALSFLEAALYAEELTRRSLSVGDLYPSASVAVLAALLMIVGPTLFFAPRLWVCRVDGLYRYRALASRYVEAFEHKWLGNEPAVDALLGTADLQSMADLGSSYDVVREMRVVPVSLRLVVLVVMVALLPLGPLLLFQYPLAELVGSLVARVVGL